jgi:hypothetical protein
MNTKSYLAGALACLLSGCATLAPDGGFDAVAATTAQRIGARPQLARDDAAMRAVQDTVRAELAKPLDMDGAVRVALVNHPGLQASYWQVGIAQADLAQAARLPNPTLGFKRLAGGGDIEIERGLGFNLVRPADHAAGRAHGSAPLRTGAARGRRRDRAPCRRHPARLGRRGGGAPGPGLRAPGERGRRSQRRTGRTHGRAGNLASSTWRANRYSTPKPARR